MGMHRASKLNACQKKTPQKQKKIKKIKKKKKKKIEPHLEESQQEASPQNITACLPT
jgi:hypothetical protein